MAESEPARARVRGCASRIDGGSPRRDRDTIIGPLRFNMQDYGPLRTWREMVRSDQWLKSPARVRAGAQVTLVVPPEQRPWMRLTYAHGGGGAAAVTLRACRHKRSRAARRRECVWTEGVGGYKACRSGPTFFSGGFEIDYDEAPQPGRCAELIVWVDGEQEPHRVWLLPLEPGECAGYPAWSNREARPRQTGVNTVTAGLVWHHAGGRLELDRFLVSTAARQPDAGGPTQEPRYTQTHRIARGNRQRT